MQCFHPITIKNPKKKRNGCDFNSITVPCGKCPACLKRRQNDWAFRIMQEAKDFPNSAYFVTLTYDDNHLPTSVDEFTGELLHSLNKAEISKFLKKLRTYMVRDGFFREFDVIMFGKPKVEKRAFRFFLCGEYGSRLGRPHYHICLFTYHVFTEDELKHYIHSVWQKCEIERVTCTRVGVESAKYVAKYCCKQFGVDYTGLQPPFALMSRMSAIGSNFLHSREAVHAKKNSVFMCFDSQHTPYSMPKLYRDKLFNDRQKRNHSLECIIQRENSERLISHTYYRSYSDYAFHRYSDRIIEENRLIKQLTLDSVL